MEDPYFNQKYVKIISGQDFEGARLKTNELAVVFFYATYCGYCSSARKGYEEFSQMSPFIEVYAIDGPEHSQVKECINIEYGNLIGGWPTIIFFKNGKPVYVVQATQEARTAIKLQEVAMKLKSGDTPS